MVTSKENGNLNRLELAQKEGEISASKVIATNALITDSQFESLRESLGKMVTIERRVVDDYSEEFPSCYSNDESTILHSFNYVLDNKTGKKYLAFLKYDKRDPHFVFYSNRRMDGIIRDVTINKVIDSKTHAPIWSFDAPKEAISFQSIPFDEYVQKIEKYSESSNK